MNMIKEVDAFCVKQFKKGKVCHSSRSLHKNKLCKYSKYYNMVCKFKWLEEKYKKREAEIKQAIDKYFKETITGNDYCSKMGICFDKGRSEACCIKIELKQELFKE